MELDTYVGTVRQQLEAAAGSVGGDAADELVRQLTAALDPAVRLAIQDALTAAADEITVELAPGSVELRLRGRELSFAVTAPPEEDRTSAADDAVDDDATFRAISSGDGADAAIARINVRMPEQLKARVEQAAEREGLSVNAWLVRAAAARVERGDAPSRQRDRRAPKGAQRYTGWAR